MTKKKGCDPRYCVSVHTHPTSSFGQWGTVSISILYCQRGTFSLSTLRQYVCVYMYVRMCVCVCVYVCVCKYIYVYVCTYVQMKPYKQYLFLINQPLNWGEYNNIICAVASVEGSTVEDVKEWAALHPEYNEEDEVIKTFDQKRNTRNKIRNIKTYIIFVILLSFANLIFSKMRPDNL